MALLITSTWHGTPGPGVPRALRRPCRYDSYVPDRLRERQILLPPDVAEDLGEAERAVRHLNEGTPALASLESVARLLLRAEAIASSRIEGLEVGARRLARAEVARVLGQPAQDVTAETVLGNVEAMQLAVTELAGRHHLAVEDILELHRALMRHTQRPEYGGRVRTTQNWIGGNDFNPCGAEFVPPPPEYVPGLLEDLVAYLNSDEHPPLVQAAVAHLQFETIHPFADGNGRVGRALIHVVLRRRRLAPRYVPPISLVLATRSRDYVRGLTAARYAGPPDSAEAHAGLAEWLRVFAAATARASADAERFGELVDELLRRWRAQAAPVRAKSAADLLLQVLPTAPIITVASAARLIGRSVQATNEAVERLVQAGVLTPIKPVRWRRAFEAEGLLDALTGVERALASPTGDTRDSPPVRPVPAHPRRRTRRATR